ncbi:hypothetical protein AX15_001649 [Amanita polypyramis BW_CC]|nr:hypothetical protein AX15_001649 [Amanita polypyramis BW_CC]
MPFTSTKLQIIPEEDEPRSAASSSSSWASSQRPVVSLKRTFSTSYIEVSLSDSHVDNDDKHDSLSLPRRAPRPPVTPPKCTDTRSGATSPTPSTSSSSSNSPPTPTSSDDEFPVMKFNPRRVSIRPLNIVKNNSQTPASSMTSFLESDSEDESDSEWYTREFSNILSLSSPPSFPKQQPSRPESLSLEPLVTEEVIAQPPKRAAAPRSHKRSRSIPKEAPPPVPAIPAQFLQTPTPSIPEIVEPPNFPTSVIQPRPRAPSIRRPPPRMSIPDDCLVDDFVNGEDESSWSSAFDLAIYEQASPAIISPAVQRLSSHLTLPGLPDSPGSMYSQASALQLQDFEDFGEIEFVVDDVKFDLSMDMPMQLPLSLPNSPIDLETDFVLGLEELRNRQEAGADELAPPVNAIFEEELEDIQFASVPEPAVPAPASEPSSSLPPTPSTSSSFDSYYDSNVDGEIHPPEDLSRPVLRSKWSNSTLSSVREEHAFRSKFAAASKLRLYFGGGGSPLSKSKQQQRQPEVKQHKRSGSAAAIAAAKAAVARATSSAIHNPPTYPVPSTPLGSSSPSSVGSPVTLSKKKAQREVVVLPPPSPAFYRRPITPTSPRYSPVSSSSPSPYGKAKRRSGGGSDVMVIGYSYGGVERELRRRGSMTPTVSDAGSEESCESCASNGLRRKPIPVEMFLRGAAGSP